MLIIFWGIPYINFGRMILTQILIAQTGMSVGLTISSLAPNMETAPALAPLFSMPMNLFGGFLVNTATMPAWISWV